MWKDIIMLKKGFGGSLWCVCGDFNAVKCDYERRGIGGRSQVQEQNDFRIFIEDLSLVDLPVLGNRFTWFMPDGFAMSRIDIFLLSEGWVNHWGVATQWAGDKDVSDHCPIILKCEIANWGPKPFRFNNCWLQHPDFKSFVEEPWVDLELSSRRIFYFKLKLKLLKERIKVWNAEVFGNLYSKICNLIIDLNTSDAMTSDRNLSLEEIGRRWVLNEESWNKQKQRDCLMYQTSRVKWLKEGDSNSSFFHSYVKYRRQMNNIVALLSEDRWVDGVE